MLESEEEEDEGVLFVGLGGELEGTAMNWPFQERALGATLDTQLKSAVSNEDGNRRQRTVGICWMCLESVIFWTV